GFSPGRLRTHALPAAAGTDGLSNVVAAEPNDCLRTAADRLVDCGRAGSRPVQQGAGGNVSWASFLPAGIYGDRLRAGSAPSVAHAGRDPRFVTVADLGSGNGVFRVGL